MGELLWNVSLRKLFRVSGVKIEILKRRRDCERIILILEVQDNQTMKTMKTIRKHTKPYETIRNHENHTKLHKPTRPIFKILSYFKPNYQAQNRPHTQLPPDFHSHFSI